MKLFGEFLVKKGLIDSTQLLAAIIEQIEATPSLPVLLFRYLIIPHSELLIALGKQASSRKDLRSICIELGYWHEECDAQVEEALQQSRVPLGQVLLSKGLITFSQLAEALNEYFRENGSGYSLPEAKEELAEETELRVHDTDSREARALLGSYVSPVFLDELDTNLRRIASSGNSPTENQKHILISYHHFHLIRGVLTFMQLKRQYTWWFLVEEIFRLAALEDGLVKEQRNLLVEVGVEGLRLLGQGGPKAEVDTSSSDQNSEPGFSEKLAALSRTLNCTGIGGTHVL